jgi:hypothetical protein
VGKASVIIWCLAIAAGAPLAGEGATPLPGRAVAGLHGAGGGDPPAGVVRVALLHALLEPGRLTPIDTRTLFTVQGIVTTHVNLTSGANGLFCIQDETAGIAVFYRGGAGLMPSAGDLVRVTAPLSQFNGLLELAPRVGSAGHQMTVLTRGNPPPAPLSFDPAWQVDPNYMEQMESRYVVMSNVFLDLTTPAFSSSAAYRTVTITNAAGDTFVLFVNAQTDLNGQAKPTTPVTILGVLSQFDPSSPFTSGYQIVPTRFADILSPAKAPAIRFTNVLDTLLFPGDLPINTFTEHALRPGERLTMTVQVSDPGLRLAHIEPITAGLPPSAAWTFDAAVGTNLVAVFRAAPTAAESGNRYEIHLAAWNSAATNVATWVVYVPTAAEQQVAITEYLANPASSSASTFFNPLEREAPAPQPGTDDEFVEVANLSESPIDLRGWTMSDGNSPTPRLVFHEPLVLTPSSVAIAYGGPADGYPPGLDVPCRPATESAFGLALNNGGDAITLRNAASNIVARVVYSAAMVSDTGSMTRFPDAYGPFVPHASVSTLAISPGRLPDGRRFDEPAAGIRSLSLEIQTDGTVVLGWDAATGGACSVLWSEHVAGPYVALARDITEGRYRDPAPVGGRARFYRVSSP